MQTPMTSCHLIRTWHEWNMNAGDIMATWFASYAILVMSQWACVSHAHVHGICALSEMGMLKYSNGLMAMPANQNYGN